MIDYDSNMLNNFYTRQNIGRTDVLVSDHKKKDVKRMLTDMRQLENPITIMNRFPTDLGQNIANHMKFKESLLEEDIKKFTHDPRFEMNKKGERYNLINSIRKIVQERPVDSDDQIATYLQNLPEFQGISYNILSMLVRQVRQNIIQQGLQPDFRAVRLTPAQIAEMRLSPFAPEGTERQIAVILGQRVALRDNTYMEDRLQRLWQNYQNALRDEGGPELIPRDGVPAPDEEAV